MKPMTCPICKAPLEVNEGVRSRAKTRAARVFCRQHPAVDSGWVDGTAEAAYSTLPKKSTPSTES